MASRACVFGLCTALLACSRTAPEPAPAASVQTDTLAPSAHVGVEPKATAAPPSNRCVTPLPAKAPAIPPNADSWHCPTDPEPNQKLPTSEVMFPDAPSTPHVEVELAKTPHDIERGLMYRRSMPAEHGMLFRLDGRRDHTFWMRNTCIALDMMFIDDDGLIVGIVEGAEPLTESVRSVGCPSVFVLEVNGGWARKHGVAPGQKVTIPSSAR